MRTVALDLGGRKICYCEIADGKVVLRKTVGKLDELADVLAGTNAKARVAIEACREAWHISDVLTSWGNEPVLVDTTRVRQLGIGQHKRKNDRIDAETLARALAQNRIPVAHLLSPARRHLRLKLSVRAELVKTRADYVITIRGLLRAVGKAPSSCSVKDFSAALEELKLDESELQLIAPLRSLLAPLQQQIQRVDLELEALAGGDPVIANLATAPGVALIVGAAFASVIDCAKRFANAHQVEAYLGLVPSENTSGKRKLGSITKQGNSYLRALLVQSAWGILKMKDASDPLKRWGKAVEKRRGKRIAAIAIARRLAGILWAMWRKGTVYEPARLACRIATGLELDAQTKQQQADALRGSAKKLCKRGDAVKRAAEKGNAMNAQSM